MKKAILALAFLSLISCNKDFGNYFDKEIESFPSQNIEGINTIAKEDTLYSFLSLVSRVDEEELTEVGCIEFIYPFVLFRYDDNDNYIDQVAVLGNENFATILDDLEENYSIGLSYPISGNLIDGTLVNINSNEELELSLETCIEEELEIIIGSCNAIVQDCIWKITESDPAENPYIDSFFTLREDGTVLFSIPQQEPAEPLEPVEVDSGEEDEENADETLTYENEVGTWVFYFIGPDLHMNINFGPIEADENGMVVEQDSVKVAWNFDWKINYIDLERIEIEKNYTNTISTENGEEEELVTEEITLEKECEAISEETSN